MDYLQTVATSVFLQSLTLPPTGSTGPLETKGPNCLALQTQELDQIPSQLKKRSKVCRRREDGSVSKP